MPVASNNQETHLNEDYLAGDIHSGDYPGEEDENGGDMEGLVPDRMSTKLRDGVISPV